MSQAPSDGKRKVFSAGEALTMASLALSVLSGSLRWADVAPQSGLPGAVGVLLVRKMTVSVTGFDLRIGWMRVGWIVVACAVLSGTLLLWEPTAAQKRVLLPIQCGAGGIVLAVALFYIGMYPGVLVALACGAMLILGALARYR